MSVIGDFVTRFLPAAQDASNASGVPASFILGQAGLESDWGRSYSATTRNNFFGIGGAGNYRTYADPAGSFADYGALMQTPRYAACRGSADQIAACLTSSGYTGTPPQTPDYASRVGNAVSAVTAFLGGDGAGAGTGAGTGATAATGGATAGAGAAGTPGAGTPSGGLWGQFTGWLTNVGGRAGLILVGVIFLLGAMYIFASRTANVPVAVDVAT